MIYVSLLLLLTSAVMVFFQTQLLKYRTYQISVLYEHRNKYMLWGLLISLLSAFLGWLQLVFIFTS